MNEQEQWVAFLPGQLGEPKYLRASLFESMQDCIAKMMQRLGVTMVEASPEVTNLLKVKKMLVEDGCQNRFEALDPKDPRGSLPGGVWMALPQDVHASDSWLADPTQDADPE